MGFDLNHVVATPKGKVIYQDNDKKIKLFDESYSKVNILNEALNQARVEEETDLPIPKLLEVVKINNQWAIVDEYVDGTSLDILMQNDKENRSKYLNLLVDIQLNVLSKNVPLLTTIKDKFKRKISNATNIDDNIKYELMQRLEGMKNHTKLCHGDFNPANVIISKDGKYHIIDWAHVTQGNASADAARTFLLFSIKGQEDIALEYLELFANKSGISKTNIQRWIPIVAATQMTKNIEEEQEFLKRWINVVDYE